MISSTQYKLRKADDRGQLNINWLTARYGFSFGNYYDPEWMGFRNLRVLNEDRVAGGGGFAPHGHEHMEIVTYVLDGAIRHQDSTGGEGVIAHGEIQVMHAGTGIQHSEMNPSGTEETHLMQIWIEPNSREVEPGYQQRKFPVKDGVNKLHVIAAPAEEHEKLNALPIYADAFVYAANLSAGAAIDHTFDRYFNSWIQVATGNITVDYKYDLGPGDAIALSDAASVHIESSDGAEILLFELA